MIAEKSKLCFSFLSIMLCAAVSTGLCQQGEFVTCDYTKNEDCCL